MKKRILALALAGTTAFSVFGSAISANAATSTDVEYEVDAYVSYKPVASVITVTDYSEGKPAEGITYYYDMNTKEDILDAEGNKVTSVKDAKAAIEADSTIALKNQYKTYTKITVNGGYFYIDLDAINYKTIWPDATKDSIPSVAVIDGSGNATTLLSDYIKAKPNTDGSVVYSANKKSANSLKNLVKLLVEEDTKYVKPAKTVTETATIHSGTGFDADDVDDYYDTYVIPRDGGEDPAVEADGTVTVTDQSGKAIDYSKWTFNSTMSDSTAVYPFEVNTKKAQDDDGNWYLNVTKDSVKTVYAYDFLSIADTNTASNIASAWNVKNNAPAVAKELGGNGVLNAEDGLGRPGIGIRYDVVSDWKDFLSELSILEGSYYGTLTEKEFKDMYLDRYYSDPVFDSHTGIQVDAKDVDLYNIGDLLDDIWDLHTEAAYKEANTSQMVYLMQQYDKYIGEYIDQEEVATDEWGDLLVSLLNAATSDDFKTALDYNRYAAEVSRLTANYENALTSAQVLAAENDMYSLLTNSSAKYYPAKTADKSALADTMEGLYFNVGTLPTQYSVDPATTTKVASAVDYTNYNYLVATPSFNGHVFVGFTTTLKTGYYSLYPVADYYEAKNTIDVYAGNSDVKDTLEGITATDEYEWFWNVYQLAANMNASNKYQGSVDAVNDALNAAVADLAVTTTPSSMDVGAMNDAVEKYAGKIDTDYNEGYYDKYEQANDYAENVAEGKWQTRIAAMITGVAGEALTYQGTQVTVTKNDMKTVETAIKNGKTALEAIKADKNYNAAQVTALNKAIDNAQYLVDLYEGTYSNNKNSQSVNHVYTYYTGDKDQMVKSDLTAAIEAIDAAINYSEIIMGWSKNDAGKWMYGTEEGYLNNGWNKIGSVWYYFNEDGTAKQSEWFKENGKWYWLNSNCGAAYGWAKVDGKWYYFNGDNSMRTGWVKVEGNWYYLASSGAMVTGWCEVDGKWYYFSKNENALGQMERNTTIDGYKLGDDGAWIK